jgi:hypothetical protein
MNVGRSMGNVRPLVEINQSGWIQVDFAPTPNQLPKEGGTPTRRQESGRHF